MCRRRFALTRRVIVGRRLAVATSCAAVTFGGLLQRAHAAYDLNLLGIGLLRSGNSEDMLQVKDWSGGGAASIVAGRAGFSFAVTARNDGADYIPWGFPMYEKADSAWVVANKGL